MIRAVVSFIFLFALSATQAASAAPSFDCAKITAQVNRMICASPELSALDARLAADFDNTRFQGGIDGKALHAEEDAWLKTVRNACTTAACLKATYMARDAVLLDESLRAASPAAYDETRPFPADPARLAEAKALVGKSCTKMFSDRASVFPGYATPTGFQNALVKGGFVTPLEKGGARFGFLILYQGEVTQSCAIADVVVLPDAAHANAFLQCDMGDPGTYGFGMRLVGHKQVVGYWTEENGKLMRQPIGVLGGKIVCHEMESGE
jgi:uncharacterized protein YecT (DUF1311 family)